MTPAVAVSVSLGQSLPQAWYAGTHEPNGEGLNCSENTIFDLASLTKPLTTTLWCLQLVERGKMSLEDPIGKWVAVESKDLSMCPVWRLMTHTSGLPAHRPYFRGLGPPLLKTGRFSQAKTAIRRMIHETKPEQEAGQKEVYSDLSYLLLEEVCESAHAPLENIWHTLPGHGADALHYRPLSSREPANAYAATEQCPWRRELLQGQVHDDNCWTMGGVGGHAGLFGTLQDVHSLGQQWLAALTTQNNKLGLSQALIDHTVDLSQMHGNGTRVIGWDTPTPGRSSAGRFFGRRSVGHLGFTGTSLWIDPEANIVITLLTNRVSPSRDDIRIRGLRPELHDLLRTWLKGART